MTTNKRGGERNNMSASVNNPHSVTVKTKGDIMSNTKQINQAIQNNKTSPLQTADDSIPRAKEALAIARVAFKHLRKGPKIPVGETEQTKQLQLAIRFRAKEIERLRTEKKELKSKLQALQGNRPSGNKNLRIAKMAVLEAELTYQKACLGI